MFASKTLEEKTSKYNGDLKVVKTFGMGTYIQSNGLTQSGGIVETIWKQTLKKLRNYELQINNCLILGLGGGTVAKLIRKNWPGAKITGVEIDPIMIDLGKKYLNLGETKVDIKIIDAVNQIKNNKDKYDLIIVDLYNGDEFPKDFEDKSYISLIASHVSNRGIVVFNRLYYGGKRPKTVKFGNNLQKHFSRVDWFYPEANLMFLCSK